MLREWLWATRAAGIWLISTIRRRAVQLSVDADTARRAGGETAGHFLRFLDCQFTRVLAAHYSIILVHGSFLSGSRFRLRTACDSRGPYMCLP